LSVSPIKQPLNHPAAEWYSEDDDLIAADEDCEIDVPIANFR
jgi:hypothetical protein